MVTAAMKLKDTPWKESYDQLSIFKSRDITLPTKFHLVKAMVFPVVIYGCESWTIQKALRDLLNAYSKHHHCNYSVTKINIILKAINPGYSLERLRLKLKLQYFSHLVRKVPDAGKD